MTRGTASMTPHTGRMVIMSSNGQDTSATIDLSNAAAIEWNLAEPALYEHAIANGEARLSAGGALVATTGEHTGRSPKDKFIVRDATTADTIWWDGNGAMEPEAFDRLQADMQAHAGGQHAICEKTIAIQPIVAGLPVTNGR